MPHKRRLVDTNGMVADLVRGFPLLDQPIDPAKVEWTGAYDDSREDHLVLVYLAFPLLRGLVLPHHAVLDAERHVLIERSETPRLTNHEYYTLPEARGILLDIFTGRWVYESEEYEP